jgi:hypothetical protein
VTKPAVFISSTVHDFRDLRSALKFWLEELGYEVMLSEFNDFTKPLDENSYTACLKAIERASYFILLIGARTGGLFEPAEGVSITRMEYRKGYDLVQAGRMKLITFVRQDLWNIKEDRKALRDLLTNDHATQKEFSDAQIEALTKHPSNFVNDAQATFSFLQEVARIDEMKRAIADKTALPRSNWIHPFSSFQDIIAALDPLLNIKRSLTTRALETNLKRELLANLTEVTSKRRNKEIDKKTVWGDLARNHFKGDLDGSSTMPARYIKWLVAYVIVGASGRRLATQFIDQSLTSGVFLEFDLSLKSYRISSFHNALLLLKENIDRLKGFGEGYLNQRLLDFVAKYAPADNSIVRSDRDIEISNIELMPVFACFDCEENIGNLCIALLKSLSGDNSRLSGLKLNRSNPLDDEASKIEAESTTVEEVEEWAKNQ